MFRFFCILMAFFIIISFSFAKAAIGRNEDQHHNQDQAQFLEVAKGLVYCHESFGILQAHYDETGQCDPDENADPHDSSLWVHKSTNPTIKTDLKGVKTGTDPAGPYKIIFGEVSFLKSSQANCNFFAEVYLGSEDASIKILKNVFCH